MRRNRVVLRRTTKKEARREPVRLQRMTPPGVPSVRATWHLMSQAGGRFGRCWAECRGILRAVWRPAPSLRWPMGCLLGFNVLIAAWDAFAPLILSWGVDAFRPDTPYFDVAVLIATPILAFRFPPGVLLAAVRDMCAIVYLRARLFTFISETATHHGRTRPWVAALRLGGNGAPALQAGRANLIAMVESLLRDPIFALRGFAVLAYLAYAMPGLALLVGLGILIDLLLTCVMDAHLERPYAQRQRRQNRLYRCEMQALGDDKERWLQHLTEEGRAARYRQRVASLVRTTVRVEVTRALYETVTRETLTLLFVIATSLVAAWSVCENAITVGGYVWFVQMAAKATDPMQVVLNIQRLLMTTRESIRELGILMGVDFGITEPTGLRSRVWQARAGLRDSS
jgi:ABC-type multidrug transport system fused ATPase/permease subunit